MKKTFLSILLITAVLGHCWAQAALYVEAGTTLYVSGGIDLTLHNLKLTNNGTLTANNGNLHLTGSATPENSIINGAGTSVFGNLSINKSSNDAQLGKDIEVRGILNLVSGGLELLSGDIDFGNTGALQSETETRRIYGVGGVLRANANLNAPSSANPGNLGAIITTNANLGPTTVERSHAVSNASGGSSIGRHYNISPTNNSGLNATLRFQYFDAELNGSNEGSLVLWRLPSGGSNWTPVSVTSRDVAANWIEASGLNTFSDWTAGSTTPLPLQLLDFRGVSYNRLHQLSWETATERNVDYFGIEYSKDALVFTNIGSIDAQGESSVLQRYRFDNTRYSLGTNYYRLRMVDNDGSYEYSPLVAISENSDGNTMLVYPNPSSKGIFYFEGGEVNGTRAIVTNTLGQSVQKKVQANELDLSDMPVGIYNVHLIEENTVFRLVKSN